MRRVDVTDVFATARNLVRKFEFPWMPWLWTALEGPGAVPVGALVFEPAKMLKVVVRKRASPPGECGGAGKEGRGEAEIATVSFQ